MEQPLKWFEEHKFVAIVRSGSADDAEKMIKSALAGGFKILEISMQTPQALKLIETVSKKEGVLVGAGAVLDGEMAQRAINSGAKFLASLYTDDEIINVSKNNDSFVIQGASTPSEAFTAYQLGADLVRIFPASFIGGPAFVKAVKGALPFVKLIASGGVTQENAAEYLKYCVAVTIGKAIYDKSLIRSDSWSEITDRAKQFTQKLESLKVAK